MMTSSSADFQSKNVWVLVGNEGFLRATIVDIGTATVTVAYLSQEAEQQLAKVPYDAVFAADDNEKRVVDDNCSLMYLNEATLHNNVRLQYFRDQIYTYVANILISVNPYFEINALYSSETIKKYQGKSLGVLPPHIYSIADVAYRDMKRSRISQSIIVSGESGAGKTESQKQVLRYYCESWGSLAGPIEQRILETNPILESFGNAKTKRNNNSSRFGKFVEIHFNNKFIVIGGHVSHYLLERSRVVSISRDERNYHVFYQLCAANYDKRLFLASPDYFNYLRNGCTQYFCSAMDEKALDISRCSVMHRNDGALRDSVVDDLAGFRRLDLALNDIGLSNQHRFEIYSIVAALLHLGNLRFDENVKDAKGGSCLTDGVLSGDGALCVSASLLGVDSNSLLSNLTSRMMQPSGAKGTIIRVPLKPHEADYARDALVKAIYSRLFDYIIVCINKCIPFSASDAFIGILDIAGFEFFTVNGFEQFCINYCNEKLQQFFNDRILKKDQELYQKEGLDVNKIDYVDNQDCIDLIEARGCGIFDLLDEESKLPRGNTSHFTLVVHQTFKQHFRLLTPRKAKLKELREMSDEVGLVIRHFAGAVCYETTKFLDKNNDAMHVSLQCLMSESSCTLLKQLFLNDKMPVGPSKLSFISIGSKFRQQLQQLMHRLDKTGTHFVRCIKPNSNMVPHLFDSADVLNQLQCSGMVSVLKLMQQGFPSRIQFVELYRMYENIMPNDLKRLDPRLFCKCLFKALGLNDVDYKFGLTKVFFRSGKFAEFDAMLRTDSTHLSELLAKVRQWLIRSRWKKVQYCAWQVIKLKKKILYRRHHLIVIQSWLRSMIAQRKYRSRIQAALTIQKLIDQLKSTKPKLNLLSVNKIELSEKMAELENKLLSSKIYIRTQPLSTTEINGKCSEMILLVKETLIQLKAAESLTSQLHLEEERHARKQQIAAQHQKECELKQNIEIRRRQLESEEFNLQNLLDIEQEKRHQELAFKQLEQEKRDREIAVRLAHDGGIVDFNELLPSHLPSGTADSALVIAKYDLSKWCYAELRDAINTSNDIDLIQSCRDEFHKRLRIYRNWREKNEPFNQNNNYSGISKLAAGSKSKFKSSASDRGDVWQQRFFRIPFVQTRPCLQLNTSSGWWYAHFDGPYIARQLELLPNKQPVLLIAGRDRDDLEMCELELHQTGLTMKKGAEILAAEFESEWKLHGGPDYIFK